MDNVYYQFSDTDKRYFWTAFGIEVWGWRDGQF